MRTIIAAIAVIAITAFAVPARAGMEEALAAYEAEDYATALREYLAVAEQGVAEAQYSLGIIFYEGLGVEHDTAEAVRWTRLAAEQDYAPAQNKLGLMYLVGFGVPLNGKEALRWWRLAAEQGLATAQNNLGNMYMQGRGIPMDIVEGRKWIEKAAEQGISGTVYNITLTFFGYEVVLSLGEALFGTLIIGAFIAVFFVLRRRKIIPRPGADTR